MNREPIYAAIFAKLQSVSGFQVISRRLKHWADVPAGDQPALFMVQKSERAVTQTQQPTDWVGRVLIYVYVNAGRDPNVSPAPALNAAIDAVQTALAPDAVTGKQTLGGLVHYCRIDGDIETDEGVLQEQAVAVIPIEFRVAD